MIYVAVIKNLINDFGYIEETQKTTVELFVLLESNKLRKFLEPDLFYVNLESRSKYLHRVANFNSSKSKNRTFKTFK